MISSPRIKLRGGRPPALVATALALLCCLALASPTTARSATSETEESRSLIERAQFAYWKGRTCALPTCGPPRPGTVADVASFGAAAFAGVWYSRRRKSPEG